MVLTVRSDDDVEAACLLHQTSSAELAERFADVRVAGRWFAYEDEVPIGLAFAAERPDRRLFVTHRLTSEAAFAPLLERALDSLDDPVHVTVTADMADRLRVCV